MLRHALPFLAVLGLCTFAVADDEPGHSHQGSAFDSGLRSRPWKMRGIGDTPFPITTRNPEVQAWFNQGIALLHSFWFEEAERSFRWCLKLDPNCAMAYWGLARCGFTWFVAGYGSYDDKQFGRYKAFLAEAVKREGSVSERERQYIEVWRQGFADNVPNRSRRIVDLLQALVATYPKDVEAKALLGLFGIGVLSRPEDQAILDQVLAKNPMHPGALHATIHNWDDVDPTKALDACRRYGNAAPAIGHARHMPGHIYSKVGMWHEAAISMDSATRVELKYMNDRLALPFEDWDYAHNRNYLCYIQEQLGMLNASLEGARDLLAAPRDRDVRGYDDRAEHEGFKALLRALIKFDRWRDILTPGVIPWQDADASELRQRPLDEILALVGEGRLAEARSRLDGFKSAAEKAPDKGVGAESDLLFQVVEGKMLVAEGKVDGGIHELTAAAAKDSFGGDPPDQPWPLMRLAGDAYLHAGKLDEAIQAYNAALAREPNDPFTLSGLAQAYQARGDGVSAERFADRLVYEWSDADPDLKWLTDVKALGLGHKPLAETPAPERRYDPAKLAYLGPSNWTPFVAPKLDVRDTTGRRVTLEQYRGKNVLLVFYLGASCIHCVQQLELINRRMSDFSRENTIVLAVSSAALTSGQSALDGVQINLLTDHDHENARRFASYDDFENLELHSTILVDRDGRVRWKRTGGEPFTNVDFLLAELARINADDTRALAGRTGAARG